MKAFQSSNYECGNILSYADLHADSEYGTYRRWFSLEKKLFTIYYFYCIVLLRKNRRIFPGLSRPYSSAYKLQICSRGVLCNFRPIFLFNLLQWPIIRHFCEWGPLCSIKSKIGYHRRTFLQFMAFIKKITTLQYALTFAIICLLHR